MLGTAFSQDIAAQFNAVSRRAERLGVLDIHFSGTADTDALVRYKTALDIVEKNNERLDRNAVEV